MPNNERLDIMSVDVRLAANNGDDIVADLPVFIECPEHERRGYGRDTTASLAVYMDHIHCYGCDFHITRRLDSLGYLLGITDFHEILQVARRYTTDALDAYRERVGEKARKDLLPPSLADAYQSLLWNMRNPRIDWLKARGLTLDTIRDFKFGHDSTRFTIPFFRRMNFDDARPTDLVTVRFRRDDMYGTEIFNPKTGKMYEIPKYSGMTDRNGLYLYPEWKIAYQHRSWLVVCEGELDAALCWQEGIFACSTTNGAGNMKHIVSLLEPYRSHFDGLMICGDMDERGRKASEQVYDAAKQAGIDKIQIAEWDEQYKDITEFFVGTGRNQDALEEVIYGRY